MRKMYFERMETDAANTATHQRFVFNKRLKPKEDISTEGIPFFKRFEKGIFLLPKKNSAVNCVARLVKK